MENHSDAANDAPATTAQYAEVSRDFVFESAVRRPTFHRPNGQGDLYKPKHTREERDDERKTDVQTSPEAELLRPRKRLLVTFLSRKVR